MACTQDLQWEQAALLDAGWQNDPETHLSLINSLGMRNCSAIRSYKDQPGCAWDVIPRWRDLASRGLHRTFLIRDQD